MKLALIGYGKMGQAVERIALQRNHEIVARINSQNPADLLRIAHFQPDVAIEFTHPEAAKQNVLHCLHAGIRVVSGSTGWNTGIPEAIFAAEEKNISFLHASNFSVGVNIFFEVNKLLARLMNHQPDYDITIEETHHTHKKDAPSGTALTIAEQIIDRVHRLEKWSLFTSGEAGILPITAHRIGNIPGTHKIAYTSEIDTIEITHTAHNRDGFALGAVLAAEFIAGKKGAFTMQDVLGIV